MHENVWMFFSCASVSLHFSPLAPLNPQPRGPEGQTSNHPQIEHQPIELNHGLGNQRHQQLEHLIATNLNWDVLK